MKCKTCKKIVSATANFCDYCGSMIYAKGESSNEQEFEIHLIHPELDADVFALLEELLEDIARCNKCGSTSLQVTKKGVSIGQAAIGALFLGPIGLAAGAIGSSQEKIVCLNCGHSESI